MNSRKIFVYAGNIGLAQDVKVFIDLAKAFRENNEIGFLFVGRGSLYGNLKNLINNNSLKNVVLHEEISNSEIQKIYRNCFAGLVSLNCKHKTHNIPGKFISYLHSGLPVFGVVNENNDIIDLINSNNLGFATSINEIKKLKVFFLNFIKRIENDSYINTRCKKFASENYNTKKISKQILNSITNLNSKK